MIIIISSSSSSSSNIVICDQFIPLRIIYSLLPKATWAVFHQCVNKEFHFVQVELSRKLVP